MDNLTILDTTLRDGAQAEGIWYSQSDKLHILKMLDSIFIDYIELGNPYSNPKDIEVFNKAYNLPLNNSKIVAFCSTRKKNSEVDKDDALLSTLKSNAPTVAIFGKSSKMHVLEVLKTTEDENISMIYESVKFMKDNGREVIFDAEHFFDGFLQDSEYAIKTVTAAYSAGADIICLCDTNGGTFTKDIYEITKKAVKSFPDTVIGIHAHNDCGCAVANSITAYLAGARHIQGTLLGMGERCGNASLSTIIPNLQLKMGIECIPYFALEQLTSAARYLSEISNVYLPPNTPYVGKSAFSHKAGMHIDGVLKNSKTFEHIDPKSVGNERKFLVSEMAGKSTLISRASEFIPDFEDYSQQVKPLLFEIKKQEQSGFQYEVADASFELFVRKFLGLYSPFYNLVNFKIINEQPAEIGRCAVAIVKIKVGDNYKLSSAEGIGPVNAMDLALRKALSVFYPCLKNMHLIDFKVRVLNTKIGTDAVVRVLIESTDGNDNWTTIGVSADIIEASFMALSDSIEYMLLAEEKKNNG